MAHLTLENPPSTTWTFECDNLVLYLFIFTQHSVAIANAFTRLEAEDESRRVSPARVGLFKGLPDTSNTAKVIRMADSPRQIVSSSTVRGEWRSSS